MAKGILDDVFDAALAEVATATRMVVYGPSSTCAMTVASATLGSLAVTAMTAGDGNGDYTIEDGASGRKVTMGAQASLTVDTTGTATHICLDDGTDLLLVTTCTNQLLTAANTVTVPTFYFQISDPT